MPLENPNGPMPQYASYQPQPDQNQPQYQPYCPVAGGYVPDSYSATQAVFTEAANDRQYALPSLQAERSFRQIDGVAAESKLLDKCGEILGRYKSLVQPQPSESRMRSIATYALSAVAGYYFGFFTVILANMVRDELGRRQNSVRIDIQNLQDLDYDNLKNELFENWRFSSSSDQNFTPERMIQVLQIYEKISSLKNFDLSERKMRFRQKISCYAAVLLQAIGYVCPSPFVSCAKIGMFVLSLLSRKNADYYGKLLIDISGKKMQMSGFEAHNHKNFSLGRVPA